MTPPTTWTVVDPAGWLEPLAQRLSRSPEQPWLFHRPGWTWRWRSFQQVADQAARGARVLSGQDELPVALGLHPHPDSLALLLAALASQHPTLLCPRDTQSLPSMAKAWLTAGERKNEEGPRDPGHLVLPPCHVGFEAWTPQSLPSPLPTETRLAWMDASGEDHPPPVLMAEALESFDRTLQDLPTGRKRDRPIVFTGPSLDPFSTLVVAAWTLRRHAVWLFEGEMEAFPPAVRWARPTLVVASAEELESLAPEIGRQGRQRRLQAVVQMDSELLSEKSAVHWQSLGIPVLAPSWT